jgi:hypothetical protein
MRAGKAKTMVTIFSILITACSPGTEVSDTTSRGSQSETPTTGEEVLTATTAEEVATTTTLADDETDCLPSETEVTRQTDGETLGRITKRLNDNVQVDCLDVFGGEGIDELSVLVTDPGGQAGFTLLEDVSNCTMLHNTELVVRPEDLYVFRVVKGEILCSIRAGERERSFSLQEGTEVLIDPDYQTTAAFMVGPNGAVEIGIIEGFANVYPSGLQCATSVGPEQKVQIRPAELPILRPYPITELPPLYNPTVLATRGNLDPPTVPAELFPGLSETLTEQQATILVDGELIGAGAVGETEALPVLERLAGHQVDVTGGGQIVVLDPGVIDFNERLVDPDTLVVPPNNLPTFPASPITSLQPGVAELVPVPIDPGELAEALAEEPVEPKTVDLMTDADGQRWSLAYDGTDEELDTKVREALKVQLGSGSYGRFYQEAFGVLPDYAIQFPELLNGAEPCERAEDG